MEPFQAGTQWPWYEKKVQEKEEKERAGPVEHELMKDNNKQEHSGLSPSEIQVLEMVRSKRFLSIKLIIKNGEVDAIEGLERLDTGERIIDMLKQHDFQNLEIKQSNGKIVCVNRIFRKKIDPAQKNQKLLTDNS